MSKKYRHVTFSEIALIVCATILLRACMDCTGCHGTVNTHTTIIRRDTVYITK